MKMNKIVKVSVFIVLCVMLTSCVGDFDPTKPDFSSNEKAYTAVVNNIANSGSVVLNTASWAYANSYTTATVTITSSKQLDESTIDSAMNFYPLSDNTANKYAYPVRGFALIKKLTSKSVTFDGTNYITEVTFTVHSESVTTEAVAFITRAEVLKDKSGAFILNGDGDDKAGETSDSYIDYIMVSNKADSNGGAGDPTDALSFLTSNVTEEFAPSLALTCSGPTYPVNADGIVEKIRYTVQAPKYFEPDAAGTGIQSVYDDSLASLLNSLYKVQKRGPGSVEWVDVSLSFTYHSEDALDATHQVNNIQAHTYTADITYPTAGTAFRLVTVKAPDLKDSKSTAYYGHQAFVHYGSNKVINVGTAFYTSLYKTAPAYIIHDGVENQLSTEVTPYPQDEKSVSEITAAQNEILTVTSDGVNAPYSWTVEVTANKNLYLDSYDGFVVVDSDTANAKTYETKVTVLESAPDGATKLRISLVSPYIDGSSFYVYVGEGTTLVRNNKYPAELSFGCYKDASKGTLSGLIKLL